MRPFQNRPHHWIAAAIALGIAMLACASNPAPNNEETIGEFATATPGGFISISLLTPTITLEGAPDTGLQVIPAVATATAQAELDAAATATALSIVPTATVPGVFADPEICPPVGTATLPSESPSFTRYAAEIAEFLSEGGAPTLLEVSLREWGALNELGGMVRADRDFTADGVAEVLVVAFDPAHLEDFPPTGDLFVFGCQNSGYRLLYQAGYDLHRSTPILYAADDLNGDRINDLVYGTRTCEEAACTEELHVQEWNLQAKSFSSLLAQRVTQPNAEIVVGELDEDPLSEIAVTAGIILAPEAGPQRAISTIYKWDGTLYTLSQVIRPTAEYRIHLIHDGDDAMMETRFDAAIDAYEDAMFTPAEGKADRYKSWTYPDEAAYLRAFARYRLMLTYVRSGNVRAAQRAHDDLYNVYIPPIPTPLPPPCDIVADPVNCLPTATPTMTPVPVGPQPGIEFMRMADLFWTDFSVNRKIKQACELVVSYVRGNPTILEVLNSFGYANREYTPESICPFTQ